MLYFFKIHNPTLVNRQGNDIGSQYRSAIFYNNNEEKELAKNIINIIDQNEIFPNKIATSLEPLQIFYEAEEYHQKYLEKHPNGYRCHVFNDFKIKF